MGGEAQADPSANFGYFHDDRHIFRIGQTGPALGFRHYYTHHSQASQFLKKFVGEFLVFIPLADMGFDPLCGEIPGRAAYLLSQFFR